MNMSNAVRRVVQRAAGLGRGFWLGIVAVAGLAMVWGRYALGPVPLDIHNTHWIWGDLAQVYVAWGQYLADPDKGWLDSLRLSHPLPMSIALFDPMPLFLLLARPLAWLLPDGLQLIGPYFLLCVVMQGVFGYLATERALRLLDEPYRGLNAVIAVLGGMLFALAPFTFFRFQGHTALSSQWLLVLSIWVTLLTLHSSRNRWLLGNCGVVLLAAGINPYLCLMVLMNVCGITVLRYRTLGWPQVALRIAAAGLVAALGLSVFGFMGASGTAAGGYGMYSMNVLGPLDSNGLARIVGLDIADPTGGQAFEGFNYLGIGVLLMGALAVSMFINYRGRVSAFPFVPALGVVLGCYLLALSTTVYFGSQGHHFTIPPGLEAALSRFRSSGRFFWMSGFWIILIGLSGCVLRLGAARALPLLMLILVLQVVDVQPIARNIKFSIANGQTQELHGIAPGKYSAILVYPAWQCDNTKTPLGIRNYESVGVFALRHGVATNNFYAARSLPEQLAYHCDYPHRLERLDKSAIYLLSQDLYATYGGRFGERFECKQHVNGDDSWLCVPRR